MDRGCNQDGCHGQKDDLDALLYTDGCFYVQSSQNEFFNVLSELASMDAIQRLVLAHAKGWKILDFSWASLIRVVSVLI